MHLLDELDNVQATKQTYNFLTGDDDNFIKELRQPKQQIINQNILDNNFEDHESSTENFDNFFNQDNFDNEPTNNVSLDDANSLAELLVTAVDIPASYGLAALAKDKESRDTYLLTPYETERATKALGKYIQSRGGDIPPSVMCLIVFGGIYLGKVVGAVQSRKAKEKEEKLEEQLVTQEDLIKSLKRQLEEVKTNADTTTEK